MSFFSRAKKRSGWLAIGFHAEGVCAACIKRFPTMKPKVRICETFAGKQENCAEALEKIQKDLQANRYHCTSILNAGEYQIMAVEAPNVPAAELKIAVRWRLKELLDYPVEEGTYDALIIPPDTNAPERNHQVFAIAAHNRVIARQQNLLFGAGLDVKVIDLPELAQRNISALLETEGSGLAMLYFDADGGLLTVTYAGNLYLVRRIDVNLQQLEGASSEAREAAYDKITLELQRSLDHFDRQYHFINVSKLILAPSGEEGERLHNYLTSNMYLPIEHLDFLEILDCSKVPQLKDKHLQQRYFLTLGAALRLEEHPA